MRNGPVLIVILLFIIIACDQKSYSKGKNLKKSSKSNNQFVLNTSEKTLAQRISTPPGYSRIDVPEGSFQKYLRELPLKPHGANVKYYNGSTKLSQGVYIAVVDLNIGKRDLHQCADAIIRLRAEYLWEKKLYQKIHFNFTNGFRVDYLKWMNGNRISVKGNNTYWIKKGKPSNTYKNFWKYMEIIFSYAGTLSLSKELKSTKIDQINIGNVFIQGGTPGHAVIVVDVAKNKSTGKTAFLLAQSYMPAQEIQILLNPKSKLTSPWYYTDFGNTLNTPEWSFEKSDLKKFDDE